MATLIPTSSKVGIIYQELNFNNNDEAEILPSNGTVIQRNRSGEASSLIPMERETRSHLLPVCVETFSREPA